MPAVQIRPLVLGASFTSNKFIKARSIPLVGQLGQRMDAQ